MFHLYNDSLLNLPIFFLIIHNIYLFHYLSLLQFALVFHCSVGFENLDVYLEDPPLQVYWFYVGIRRLKTVVDGSSSACSHMDNNDMTAASITRAYPFSESYSSGLVSLWQKYGGAGRFLYQNYPLSNLTPIEALFLRKTGNLGMIVI